MQLSLTELRQGGQNGDRQVAYCVTNRCTSSSKVNPLRQAVNPALLIAKGGK